MPKRARRKLKPTVGPKAKTPKRVLEENQTTNHISEFSEAKKRFHKFTGNDLSDTSDDNIQDLNKIVSRLCRGDPMDDIEKDPNLFFDLIYHSDFLQIKTEVIETFYCELFNTFMFRPSLHKIIANLDRLDNISHVKKYIALAFFKIFNVEPLFLKDCLVLKYSEKNIWCDLVFNQFDSIQIRPCAYKVLMSNDNFDFIYINVLCKLFHIHDLILNGCNLNRRNLDYLFRGSELKSLKVAECGTSINNVLFNYSSNTLKNLTDLNVSKNPLNNKTLEIIRLLPLKSLNISDCIKRNGCFFNGIWFAEPFRIMMKKKIFKGEIDILWADGCLKETLETLNISYNAITSENLRKIFQLKLKELDITDTMETLEFSKFIVRRRNTLKILKARKNKMFFEEFKSLCCLKLERLELDYYSSQDEDFSNLSHWPLTNNLKELSLGIVDPCRKFISLISKFKLRYLDCEVGNSCYFESFFNDYPKQRQHLEILKIQYYATQPSNKFLESLKKLNNLKELTISTPSSRMGDFNEFLGCENLQKSLVKLTLGKADEACVSDEDLKLLTKFTKLERLAFTFDMNITEENLQRVIEMKSLKKLKLEAVVSKTLTSRLARLLCIASVKSLVIRDNLEHLHEHPIISMTEVAYNYLIIPENLSRFCKNLETLYMMGINPGFAAILRCARLQEIVTYDTDLRYNGLKILLQSKLLRYTLEHLHCINLGNMNLIWRDIAKLKLSRLELDGYYHSDEGIYVLSQGPIFKFLRVLFLEEYKPRYELLLHTSISEVNTDDFGSMF